jgi:hypothetical protein
MSCSRVIIFAAEVNYSTAKSCFFAITMAQCFSNRASVLMSRQKRSDLAIRTLNGRLHLAIERPIIPESIMRHRW